MSSWHLHGEICSLTYLVLCHPDIFQLSSSVSSWHLQDEMLIYLPSSVSPWHLQGEMLINLPRSAPLWLLFVVALLSLFPRHGFEVRGQVEDGARPIICNHSTQCSVDSHLKQANVTFIISFPVGNQKRKHSVNAHLEQENVRSIFVFFDICNQKKQCS